MQNMLYIGKIKHLNKIYNGIHKPIIYEETFYLAQRINKANHCKLRLYRKYTFAGLIKCKECGSTMTPCHTNKRKNGKLTRYYYYRCSRTFKNTWQSCSTKQVIADKLESYIFKNLEKITYDIQYIDNLIYRIKHDDNSSNKFLQPFANAGASNSSDRRLCKKCETRL